MLAEAKEYRDKLIEAVSDFDDAPGREVPRPATRSTVDQLMLAIRKATISLKFFGVIPGSAFKKKGIQRVLDCVVNYLPSPIDVPPMSGQGQRRRARRGRRRRQGQGRRPRVQALDRPVRRQARVLPRLHRHGEEGHLPLQPAHPPQRARLAPRPHARHRPRGDRRRLLGRHLRPGGRQGRHHGRHALRRGFRHPPRAAVLPGAGHLDVDRAEFEGRPGEDGHRAPAPGRRGPDAQGQDRHRTRARSSSPAWASSTSRSSSTA